MQFKGEHRLPTPDIAKMLNVDAAVEGSVMRSGDRVRIIAQLIDAPEGKHLWAKSYEPDSRDVLALQDEVASALAKKINVELTPAGQARLASASVITPGAYDAYLKGHCFINRPSDENLTKAIVEFEEAAKLDPNFAPRIRVLRMFTSGLASTKALCRRRKRCLKRETRRRTRFS